MESLETGQAVKTESMYGMQRLERQDFRLYKNAMMLFRAKSTFLPDLPCNRYNPLPAMAELDAQL